MSAEQPFESPLAGRWFSAKPENLRRELESLLPHPSPHKEREVCAIVVPHAGYAYSGHVSAGVYARLDPDAFDRVVIMGPSHHVPLRDCVSILPVVGFKTPLGTSPADSDWIRRALELPGVVSIDGAHAEEHSDQIQIPMVQQYLGMDKKLACLVVGWFDPEVRLQFARGLRSLLDGRTLVVVSTDFTHYGPQFGYQPFLAEHGNTIADKLAELDGEVFDAFASWGGDRLTKVLTDTGATVCGREVLSLLLALKPEGANVVKTAYATSGELMDDWTNSVSYVGALVKGAWGPAGKAQVRDEALSPAEQVLLLKLARKCVEEAAATGQMPTATEFVKWLTPGVRRPMGAFVTLHLNGQLRGCIGEIEPQRPLWQAVRDNAAHAALHDPRFRPVTSSEVPFLEIEISALSPPRAIPDWQGIEIGRHGVVLEKSGRRAVFLPQVAPEQQWDRATLLDHLAMKAGLPRNAWRDGAAFEVFEAQVFHEGEGKGTR